MLQCLSYSLDLPDSNVIYDLFEIIYKIWAYDRGVMRAMGDIYQKSSDAVFFVFQLELNCFTIHLGGDWKGLGGVCNKLFNSVRT